MHGNMLGGYQGPVAVLTPEGIEVARAACRYRADGDRDGQDHWAGRLHRIDPPGAVIEGTYRLRLPGGGEGEVAVRVIAPIRDILYFEGIGPRPAI